MYMSLRRSLIACVLMLTLLVRPLSVLAAEPIVGTFLHQDSTRTYYLYLPKRASYTPKWVSYASKRSARAPLVVLLHGYGGSAQGWMPEMIKAAERHGFALCVPQGLKDPTGCPSWNVGYPMQKGWKVDDADFLMQLCRHLQDEYGIGTRDVFLTGMSNGGEMCYLMAWQHPEFFSAIASIAGLTMEWMIRGTPVKGPVPFMEFHGTADKTSLWEGDLANEHGWGAYIAVPAAVSHIVSHNRCASFTDTVLPLKDPEKPTRKVTLHHYGHGTGGAEVLFYEVEGGDHSWSMEDVDTPELVMDFFESWRDRR